MFSNIIGICGILLGMVILLIVQVSAVPVNSSTTSPPKKDTVRQDKAKEILKYMNTSANPCEDFYEFSCGNWNTFNSAASKDQLTTGLLNTLRTALDEKLKLLLAVGEATDTEVDKKVKNFYRSCLNLPSLQQVYSAKLKEIVKEFGQMPALVGDEWREEDFDWLQTIAAIAYKYDISVIAEVAVLIDLADQSVNRLYITEQDFFLEEKSIYLNKDNANYIRIYERSIAVMLNSFLDLNVNLAVKTAKEIVEFETALAKGTWDTQTNLQFSDIYTLSTFEVLQQKYSNKLDIGKLVNLTMGTIPPLKVYVNNEYLENVASVLKATPKRKVANYILYQLLSHFLVDISETEEELQETCISKMKTYFSKNFDNMVYRKYNTKETEKAVNRMWQDIKLAFKDSLESEHYKWINKETRKYAVEKLNAMKLEIVSYENHDFATAFEQFNVDSKDYIANLKSLLKVGAIKKRALIKTPPQPLDFGKKLSTTPSNNLIENAVKVPVVLLQSNYVWSASFANAFNFGMLGALLSHELLHGFDDTGRNHDAQGNRLKWWDTASANDFNARAKCFNDQYQGYVFLGKHLPDMPSQSENIADNGGIRLAYRAYLKWYKSALEKNPKVVALETMPGLNYDNKKLFFISYGQLWCGDVDPDYRQYQAATDEHVPHKFRVNGPLSNFKEFSTDFNCPKNSGMNPEKKCEIY